MHLPNKIWLPDLVGKGYREFWNFRGRYNVCKGGRGSKKSKTTALRWIYLLMKYPLANLLVIRKTGKSLAVGIACCYLTGHIRAPPVL